MKLLFVAGEKALIAYGRKFQSNSETNQDIFNPTGLNLKQMCRDKIRGYLIRINPHLHLFDRAPKLGLPMLLRKYLLYNMSLDEGM